MSGFFRADALRAFRDQWTTPENWARNHLPYAVTPRANGIERDGNGRMYVWAWERWCLDELSATRKVSEVWSAPDAPRTLLPGSGVDLWESIYEDEIVFRFSSAAHATLFRLRWG